MKRVFRVTVPPDAVGSTSLCWTRTPAKCWKKWASTRLLPLLVEFIAGIEAGVPVLVVTYGDATAHLSEDALAALNSLGAALNAEEVRGSYFAIAGVKGAASGTAAQVIDANDAFLRVSLNRDRRPLAAAVDWVQIGR